MTERIPRVVYDKLAKSIWDLGRASMSHLVSVAPTPARVKGELMLDGEVLEPEFLIVEPETFHERLPEIVGLTVNSAEEFARDCAFTLYTWRKVVLNTHRRTREFDRGVLLMDGDGNTITPQLDMPARGSRRRPGSKAWRELRTDTNIQTFDVETAQEFIDTSERFRQHVLRSDNS
jgi:hypothetical protein